MKRFVLVLLAVIVHNCGRLTIGDDSNDYSLFEGGVPGIIVKYIRVYHDYPKNGEDLVSFMYEIENHYHYNNEPSFSIDSTLYAYYAKVFLDKRNNYFDNKCIIRSRHYRPEICIKGSLSDWQNESYTLFCNTYPAFFDKKGDYIWPKEEGEDLLSPAINILYSRYKKTLCFKTLLSYEDKPKIRPYKIRIKYSIQNGLTIHENPVPSVMYLRYPNKDMKDSFVFKPISFKDYPIQEEYIKDITLIMENLIKKNNDIETIDCFIPVFYDRQSDDAKDLDNSHTLEQITR